MMRRRSHGDWRRKSLKSISFGQANGGASPQVRSPSAQVLSELCRHDCSAPPTVFRLWLPHTKQSYDYSLIEHPESPAA